MPPLGPAEGRPAAAVAAAEFARDAVRGRSVSPAVAPSWLPPFLDQAR